MKLVINGRTYLNDKVASLDVDAEKTFTPLCPLELPVPDGHLITPELNGQALFAKYRIGSKDAHCLSSWWIDTDKHPQFEPIEGYEDMDLRWKVHGIPGTPGFQLLDGLPDVKAYDYFVWKGIELNMHPYGACFHDITEKMSTGLIEFLRSKEVEVVIVGGLATDYCVKVTVLQLLRAGFIVIVNLGACRGIAPETTAAAIVEMRDAGKEGRVVFIKSYQDIEVAQA
jgi:nicotinamidase/pyrazinamidase